MFRANPTLFVIYFYVKILRGCDTGQGFLLHKYAMEGQPSGDGHIVPLNHIVLCPCLKDDVLELGHCPFKNNVFPHPSSFSVQFVFNFLVICYEF